MNLYFLSAQTTTGLLTGSDLINLLQEGKTLSEIARQTGLPTNEISKLLKRNQISYDSFKEERQHIKYQKIYRKCYALAVQLNRLPYITETMDIRGISAFRSEIYQNLRASGFHESGRYNRVLLPCGNLGYEKKIIQVPNYKTSVVTDDKKEMIKVRSQIAEDIGCNLSKNEIIEKVSQNLVTPCFSLSSVFSQDKMKSYNKKKKKNEKLLLRLISISNQLGHSPGKDELRKIDKTFYQKLYRAFKGLYPALKQAGLEPPPHKIFSNNRREKIISELKSISEDLGFSPGKKELRKIGNTFYHKLYHEFGGLQNALIAAGLPVTRKYRNNNAISELLP